MFILGGKTNKELGLILLKTHDHPPVSATRDKVLIIPGRHGAYDFGADLEPREFELDCGIVASNKTELQSIVRNLASHLTDSRGRPRKMTLVFDAEPEKTYFVRYSGKLSLERNIRFGRLVLPFVAYDPFAYGEEQYTEQLVETSPEAISITSAGNVETPPVIVLKNEGTSIINGFVIRTAEEIEY